MRYETERDIILSGFPAFVASKPPKERYHYLDTGACAFAQYLDYIGLLGDVGGREFVIKGGTRYDFPNRLAESLVHGQHTFGWLNFRLRPSVKTFFRAMFG